MMTLSFSVGRVAIQHDIRETLTDNVDPTLTPNNVIFIDKLKKYNYDIEAYTNARFQPVLDSYNAKQRRPERRKTKKYTEIIADENAKLIAKEKYNKEHGINKSVRKPTKLVHEYVVQIGDRNSNSTLTTDIDKNRIYYESVLNDLQHKYPHMEILLATFHADEPNGTPHMHILVQYVGEGYSQGLSEQISVNKALECDGFARSNTRGNYSIERFIEDIKNTVMTEKLTEIMDEERLELNEHRKHEDIRIFRQKAKDEAKALEEQRNSTQEAKAKYEAYVTSQDQRLLEVHDKLVERRDRLTETQNTLDTERTSLTEEKAKFDAYKVSEIQALQEREKAITDKENYLKAFSERTAEIFSEALEWLEKVKKLYNALDETHKAIFKKPLAELDESLLPRKQKQKQRSKSL